MQCFGRRRTMTYLCKRACAPYKIFTTYSSVWDLVLLTQLLCTILSDGVRYYSFIQTISIMKELSHLKVVAINIAVSYKKKCMDTNIYISLDFICYAHNKTPAVLQANTSSTPNKTAANTSSTPNKTYSDHTCWTTWKLVHTIIVTRYPIVHVWQKQVTSEQVLVPVTNCPVCPMKIPPTSILSRSSHTRTYTHHAELGE